LKPKHFSRQQPDSMVTMTAAASVTVIAFMRNSS
jgi:hypothetical protein